MHFPTSFVAIATSFFAVPIIAHPGHDISQEIAERAAYLSSAEYTGLEHCAEQLQARSAEMIARRKAIVEDLRVKRGVVKRDFTTVLNTNHHSNKAVTPDSSDLAIFGSNSSCILQPETTEGPYCMFFYSSGSYDVLLMIDQGYRVRLFARTLLMAILVFRSLSMFKSSTRPLASPWIRSPSKPGIVTAQVYMVALLLEAMVTRLTRPTLTTQCSVAFNFRTKMACFNLTQREFLINPKLSF